MSPLFGGWTSMFAFYISDKNHVYWGNGNHNYFEVNPPFGIKFPISSDWFQRKMVSKENLQELLLIAGKQKRMGFLQTLLEIATFVQPDSTRP